MTHDAGRDARGDGVARLVRRLLALVLDGPNRAPAPSLPKPLDTLFDRLREEMPALEAAETEDLIWALWASHTEMALEQALNAAITAVARRRFDDAETALDAILAADPEWAEAWNKRATLHFIRKEDARALADIERTLELEPRHFGAIAGFAQICLRNGEFGAADAAIDAALAINPHLHGLRVSQAAVRRGDGTRH